MKNQINRLIANPRRKRDLGVRLFTRNGRPNIRIQIRPNPSKIRTESKSLITISKNPKFSQKDFTKHLILIDIPHFQV